MDFVGRYFIPAPVETVWDAVNDPEILKRCIPGCERLEKTSATDFAAVATLKIGPLKASFKGKVSLSDLAPPSHCKLIGEGQGGVAGFAKGHAEVDLVPEGGGTALSYVAHASVGGKLAQIGQRLIDGAAKQIADDFFGRFTQLVTPADTPEELESDLETMPAPPPQAVENERRGALAPEVWVLGLVGVVVVLLLILGAVL